MTVQIRFGSEKGILGSKLFVTTYYCPCQPISSNKPCSLALVFPLVKKSLSTLTSSDPTTP